MKCNCSLKINLERKFKVQNTRRKKLPKKTKTKLKNSNGKIEKNVKQFLSKHFHCTCCTHARICRNASACDNLQLYS